MPALPKLDSFDRKILTILQRDSAISQSDIGREVALSTAAVSRRIRRFEHEGVITRTVAVVDPVRVGRPVTIIVGISLRREGTAEIQRIKNRLAEAPEIQQCYYVTGDFDLIVVLTTESMSEYEALTQRLFFADENVARFHSFVAMDRIKATLACPV